MIDTSLLQDFITESVEHLEDMETKLLQLESDPGNSEILNDIFRSVHTIKGASEYMGMERIAGLTHKLENLLDMLRKDTITLTGVILDTLMSARDRIVLLIGDLELTQSEETTIEDVLIAIKSLIDNPNGNDLNEAFSETPEEISETSDDSEILEDFISEAKEYLEEMEMNLGLIENDPGNTEAFNELFRAIHTIKGAADFIGIDRIATLSTQLETFLLKMRQEERTPDIKAIQLISAVSNRIAILIGEMEQTLTVEPEMDDLSDAIRDLSEESENVDSAEDDRMIAEDGYTDEEVVVEQDSDDLFDDEYDEEYDEELFDIFLEQLQESIVSLRQVAGQMLHSDNQVGPLLEKYIDCIQGLYSSANYMGYEKLADYYEKWTEELHTVLEAGHPGEGLDWQDYIETKINPRINNIIKLFPQLQASSAGTDAAEENIASINAEPTNFSKNDSVLDEEAGEIAVQAELSDRDANTDQIDSDTDEEIGQTDAFDDGSVLSEEASLFAISEDEFDLDEEGVKIAETTEERDPDLETAEITEDTDEYDLDLEADAIATAADDFDLYQYDDEITDDDDVIDFDEDNTKSIKSINDFDLDQEEIENADSFDEIDLYQNDEEITESPDEFDLVIEDAEIAEAAEVVDGFDSDLVDEEITGDPEEINLYQSGEEITESLDELDPNLEDAEITESADEIDLYQKEEEVAEVVDEFDSDPVDKEITDDADKIDLYQDSEEITESLDEFDPDLEDAEITESADEIDLYQDGEEITESLDESDPDLEDAEIVEIVDKFDSDRVDEEMTDDPDEIDLYQSGEEITESPNEFNLDLEDKEIAENPDEFEPDLEDDEIAEAADEFDSDMEDETIAEAADEFDPDPEDKEIAMSADESFINEESEAIDESVLGEEAKEIVFNAMESVLDDEIDKLIADEETGAITIEEDDFEIDEDVDHITATEDEVPSKIKFSEDDFKLSDAPILSSVSHDPLTKEDILFTDEDVAVIQKSDDTTDDTADAKNPDKVEDTGEIEDINEDDAIDEEEQYDDYDLDESEEDKTEEFDYSDDTGHLIHTEQSFPVVSSRVSSVPYRQETPVVEKTSGYEIEATLAFDKTTLYNKLENAFDLFMSHSLNLDSDVRLANSVEALFSPTMPQAQPTISFSERNGATPFIKSQEDSHTVPSRRNHKFDPRAMLFSNEDFAQPDEISLAPIQSPKSAVNDSNQDAISPGALPTIMKPKSMLTKPSVHKAKPTMSGKKQSEPESPLPLSLQDAKKNEALRRSRHHKDKEKSSVKSAESSLKPISNEQIKAKSDQKKIKQPAFRTPKRKAASKRTIQKKAPASTQATAQKVDSTMETITKKSIRVDAKKIDALINQVGELVVSRAWFSQLYNEMRSFQQYLKESVKLDQKNMKQVRGITFRLSEATVALGRVANELQEGVMRVRMLPISQLFNRYPRLVRDLTHNSDKQVRLEVKGEETELDKMIIEEMSDPLIHIIRNAVDHGIETVAERRRQNKPEIGRLFLKAYHESNHVVIEISDDGGGIDPGKIKATAIERNLLGADELDLMADKELIGLITVPGFSTAAQVTTTSGRGVGMDVVKKNIEKLNGTLEIDSKVGAYTQFRIKIPLTLAIIPALLVKVGAELYTIPLAAVEETLRIYSKDTTTIEGTEVIHIRNMTLPLVRLSEIFGIPSHAESGNKEFVVVVSTGLKKIGLVVDALIGQDEVVIKPLEDYLQEKSGFSGATILGDGRISLILDVYELTNLSIERLISKRKKLK